MAGAPPTLKGEFANNAIDHSMNQGRLTQVSRQSQRKWMIGLQAIEDRERLPTDAFRLDQILGPTPKYLEYGCPQKIPVLHCDDGLYVQGCSEWETSDGECDVKTKSMSHQLLLATWRPTLITCTIDAKFGHWFENEDSKEGKEEDRFTILFLAWAYILSACWVEILQRQDSELDCSMRYPSLVPPAHEYGAVDSAATRWWIAVRSVSWCASFSSNGAMCCSPWALQMRSSGLHYNENVTSPGPNDPPSSEQALNYLAEYCAAYSLEKQCLAALSASLFIPFMRKTGLNLPPAAVLWEGKNRPSATARETVLRQGEFLNFYLTVSSLPWGLRALLHGMFFDPSINCNEVGTWLRPVCSHIKPAIQSGKCRQVALLLARHEPKLAPLWIGALLSGAAEPIISSLCQGFFAVCLTAAGWTSTCHSFIGPVKPRQILNDDGHRITRANEARLMYMIREDWKAPVCPWKPFGSINLHEAALEVQEHIYCSHFLRYSKWTWKGSTLADSGYRSHQITDDSNVDAFSTYDESVELENDDNSRMATSAIFKWLRQEGWPHSERHIYSHHWFDPESDDDSIASSSS